MGPTALHPLWSGATDFYRPYKSIVLGHFEPTNIGSNGKHATTRPPRAIAVTLNAAPCKILHLILMQKTLFVVDCTYRLDGEKNVYRILVPKLLERRPLDRPMSSENTIKTDSVGCEGVRWRFHIVSSDRIMALSVPKLVFDYHRISYLTVK
jgi:hypothetical protein